MSTRTSASPGRAGKRRGYLRQLYRSHCPCPHTHCTWHGGSHVDLYRFAPARGLTSFARRSYPAANSTSSRAQFSGQNSINPFACREVRWSYEVGGDVEISDAQSSSNQWTSFSFQRITQSEALERLIWNEIGFTPTTFHCQEIWRPLIKFIERLIVDCLNIDSCQLLGE